MEKNVIALVKEIESEVNSKYAWSGFRPNGFAESEYNKKLDILSDMFELDEKCGLVNPGTNRLKAYLQLAEMYKLCGSWN